MRNLNNELKRKTIDYNRLLEYGFAKENNQYIFKKKIYNEQFEIIVIVSNNSIVSKIMDLENDDEYVLVDVLGASGAFVGKIRNEYEEILNDIIKKCTHEDVFKSEQAKEIIKYIKEKYGDDLEFLWKKFDDNAVWRNKKNNKWYGALLIVAENKIGIDSDKLIEIIDLRYQKEDIKNFINNETIFPGYHMNKDNWITIKLDGSVKIEKIIELIDNSYKISLEK